MFFSLKSLIISNPSLLNLQLEYACRYSRFYLNPDPVKATSVPVFGFTEFHINCRGCKAQPLGIDWILICQYFPQETDKKKKKVKVKVKAGGDVGEKNIYIPLICIIRGIQWEKKKRSKIHSPTVSLSLQCGYDLLAWEVESR